MLNRRFQMLFDKDLWNKVVKTAKSQHISIGELIRRAIIEYLKGQKEIATEEKQAPFKGFFKRKS